MMIEQEIECFEKELKILSKAEKSLDRQQESIKLRLEEQARSVFDQVNDKNEEVQAVVSKSKEEATKRLTKVKDKLNSIH